MTMISKYTDMIVAAMLTILIHDASGKTLPNNLGYEHKGNITVFQYRYSQWWRMSDTIKTTECVALSPVDTRWIDIDTWFAAEDKCIRVYSRDGCRGDYIDVGPAAIDRRAKICFDMEAKSLSNCRRYQTPADAQIRNNDERSLTRYRRQINMSPHGGFPFWNRFQASRTTEPTRFPSTTLTVQDSAQNYVDDPSELIDAEGVSEEGNQEDNYAPQMPDLPPQVNVNGDLNDNSITGGDETNQVEIEDDTSELASMAEARWSPPVKICFMN